MSEKELILSLSKANGDFIVTTSRSSGPGGQNVNKRNTKVRITHLASKATSESQKYRTQEENKKEAFRKLIKSKIFQDWLRIEIAKKGIIQKTETSIGPTGNREERIRTYNIPRDEVIDHRTGTKANNIQDILDGKLDEFLMDIRTKLAL